MISEMTKKMIGLFIKYNSMFGDEPYFSLLKEFKSKFVVKLVVKNENLKPCNLFLFKVADCYKYADILDSIDYNYGSPIAIKFDETFFTESSHTYFLDGVELDKNNIYFQFKSDLAIWSNAEDIVNYFN